MHTFSFIVSYSFLAFLFVSIFVEGAILKVGKPFKFPNPHLSYVRTHGVKQFSIQYNRTKSVETPLFLWGDEIEYGIFAYNKNEKYFDLSLRGAELRDELKVLEGECVHLNEGCEWQPEYGSWMIEAVPRDPYAGYISDLFTVERNMRLRRKRLHSVLKPNEIAPTIGNFPMLGVEGYMHTKGANGPIAGMVYHLLHFHPYFALILLFIFPLAFPQLPNIWQIM